MIPASYDSCTAFHLYRQRDLRCCIALHLPCHIMASSAVCSTGRHFALPAYRVTVLYLQRRCELKHPQRPSPNAALPPYFSTNANRRAYAGCRQATLPSLPFWITRFEGYTTLHCWDSTSRGTVLRFCQRGEHKRRHAATFVACLRLL